MADNKQKLSTMKLYLLLPFIAITAISLILTGIALLSIYSSTEMVNEVIAPQKEVIDYTHCLPLLERYESCEQYFYDENKHSDFCTCFMDRNITDLRGKVTVYVQLEIADREFLSSDNSSIKTYADLVSKASRHCDPYTTAEPTHNGTCEAIPDEIFKDVFIMSFGEARVGKFSKSNRWGPAGRKTVNGFQNAVTILLMNDTLKTNDTLLIPNGTYEFSFSFYQNVNVWRRALIFSVKTTDVRYRSNVIDIVALVLGVVLLMWVTTVYVLRNRLLGNKTLQTSAGAISTEKHLLESNTDSGIEPEPSVCESPDDDTKRKLSIAKSTET